MVDKKIIQETIKDLLDAKLDKDTIIATLKDIGVSEQEIIENYNELTINTQPKETSIQETKTKTQEPTVFETTEEEKPEKELVETTKEIDKLTNEQENINDPQEQQTSTTDDSTLLKELAELEDQITSIKAEIKTLTKIMKDILEENRNILNKIK